MNNEAAKNVDLYLQLVGNQELITAQPSESKKFQGDPYLYPKWRLLFDTYVNAVAAILERRKFEELLH